MIDDNSYERDRLYREVWSEPVTAVAKRYGVSDVAIHKACKRLQVAVPPRGYWAKLSAGQSVTPLVNVLRAPAEETVVGLFDALAQVSVTDAAAAGTRPRDLQKD